MDIVIHKHMRYAVPRATIIPQTDAGREWARKTLAYCGSTKYEVSGETVDETVALMEADGLKVEYK